jgi:hypothetical protein
MLAVLIAPLLLSAFPFDAVELDGLKSTPPETWKERRPPNEFQLKVFALPKAEGDKEETVVTIFHFSRGGGSVEDNVKRWKGQIEPAEGKKIDDVAKVETFEAAGGKVKVTYFDASGTYLFRPMPANPENMVKKPGYRLVNAYFASPNGPYFIRLVGPEKSVTAQEKGFKDWVKNFK